MFANKSISILIVYTLMTINGLNCDISRLKRATSNCNLNQFACKSGQCINNLDKCDGIANCDDGSDEIKETCLSYECPQYTYKCEYGGCVFAEARCDGKDDCLDKSDEKNCNGETDTLTSVIKTTDESYCFLTEHPLNGFYYVNGDKKKKYKFGDKVPEGTQLTFGCPYRHHLRPEVNLTCNDRQWSDEVPKCEPTCYIPYRRHILVQCYRDGKLVECNPAFNGTRAKFSCTRHHENMTDIRLKYSLCTNGVWDAGFYYCPDANGGAVGTPLYACPAGSQRCAESWGCVPAEEVCDGNFNCRDRADENDENCKANECPPNNFRCSYGACVSKNARCNGIKECYDNSDEDGCPPIDIPCVVPQAPENGFVAVQGRRTRDYVPGDQVLQGTSIKYWCKLGYELTQQPNVTYCISGKWLIERPRCEKICESIKSQSLLEAKCYRAESVVDCSKPFNQTRAKLKCAPFYEDPSLNLYPHRYCLNGHWDRNLPNCIPECGQKFVRAQALIIGGNVSKQDHWPWTVGVYYNHNKAHICGGSLLNQKVVLSAAHCFSDSSDLPLPPESFIIAGGKHYRQFNHEEDKFPQYSDVQHVFIPKEYRGVDQNYRADIAVVIVKEPFVLNHNMRPVCFDWGPTFEREQLNNQKNGVVLGWGLTAQAGKPSEELKELDVPYHSIGKCTEHLAINFRRYATTGDKICGGYLNRNTSACQGDSGGGYVFERGDRYYIRGIVSVAPRTPSGSCDSDTYTLFTQVSKYNDYIANYESLYRPQ